MIGMLAKWLSSSASGVKLVQITFPIVGHFFIPPDRVFGRIEKIVRKKDIIIKPEQYKEIFALNGTVMGLGADFLVYDWKGTVETVIKPPAQWHFKFAASKRIFLKKNMSGDVKVRGEINYRSDLGVYKSILKRGKSLNNLNPFQLPIEVPVKAKKLFDVEKLLINNFGEEWMGLVDLSYYGDLITSISVMDNDDGNGVNEELSEMSYCEE